MDFWLLNLILAIPPAVSQNPNFTKDYIGWTTISDGIYSTTLWYDAYTKNINQGSAANEYVQITSRYHDGSL